MKKLLFILAALLTLNVSAQVRICSLPQTSNGTLGDYLIKEDSSCSNGTKKIKVSNFLAAYGLDSVVSGADTASIGQRFDHKVDTIYKNSTNDSIVYEIAGRRHAILDSTGGGGSGNAVDTIYKNTTQDSIVYKINGRRHALKDSTGITPDSLVKTFSNIVDFGLSDPNDYQAGTTIEVIDPVSIYINGTIPAGTYYTQVLKDSTGTNYYNPIGKAYYNGNMSRAICTDPLSGTIYLIDNSVFTYDDIVGALSINALDLFPLGTVIKITSGSTTLPSSIEYIITSLIDSAGHKKVNPNVEIFFSSGKSITGTYDLTSNTSACGTLQKSKVHVTSAQLLSDLGAGIEMIPSYGAGTAIQLLGVSVRINNSTVVYDTNTDIQFNPNGYDSRQYHAVSFLINGNGIYLIPQEPNALGGAAIVEDTSITLRNIDGNASTGDGDLDVWLTYTVILL